MEKEEIKLRAKIAGLQEKESFYINMSMFRQETLKGVNRLIPSKRKSYSENKKLLENIIEKAKQTAAEKNIYKQQLHDLKQRMK
ncbi:hypothetical protein AALA44_00310 [Enterococcus ratti]|uniref:hypothetical protein n=1 Tax=Enterococcus ratti TaxID=150033 RepID=UPI0035118730